MNKLLSDEEIENVLFIFNKKEALELITYINRIIVERNKGIDRCARPLSFRNADDCKETCFAMGYIRKIRDFIDENAKREGIDNSITVKETKKYISELLKEIKKFFI